MKIKYTIPKIDFVFRENGEFVTKKAYDLFSGKRVVIFGLPGAFTPTCSAYQLPGFEERYDEFKKYNVDEIYCISVNDPFVMNAWAKELGIAKVKLIPDGNCYFTEHIGMAVEKRNLGFGRRSWRYAAVVDNGKFEWIAEEDGKGHDIHEDPYVKTTPGSVLAYLNSKN